MPNQAHPGTLAQSVRTVLASVWVYKCLVRCVPKAVGKAVKAPVVCFRSWASVTGPKCQFVQPGSTGLASLAQACHTSSTFSNLLRFLAPLVVTKATSSSLTPPIGG